MCKPNSSPAVPHNMVSDPLITIIFGDQNIDEAFKRDEAFPGFVEFGPVTTLGELRAMKPGDPPIKYDERLYEPTPKEVYERCIAIMDRNKGGDQQGQSSKDREQVSMSEGASKEQSE